MGAMVDVARSTTRGDENVRRPCASKSMTVWYSFVLTTVPSPYCSCITRSPVAYVMSVLCACHATRIASAHGLDASGFPGCGPGEEPVGTAGSSEKLLREYGRCPYVCNVGADSGAAKHFLTLGWQFDTIAWFSRFALVRTSAGVPHQSEAERLGVRMPSTFARGASQWTSSHGLPAVAHAGYKRERRLEGP